MGLDPDFHEVNHALSEEWQKLDKKQWQTYATEKGTISGSIASQKENNIRQRNRIISHMKAEV